MHDDLKQRWHALWQSSDHDELFDDIIAHYHEPHRHYHTVTHLCECFYWFDKIKDKLNNPALVALALFYHDIIYEPTSTHNEQNSAIFAKNALADLLSDDDLAQIHCYIIATKDHINPSADGDLDYLLDIDLAILGADKDRFDEYNAQIRREFAWVDDTLYHIKRKQVLNDFYQKTPLFITPYFYGVLEIPAKANLQKALTDS